ncbi:MAG: hypothetical protein V3S69_00500, partial [Dehalococcoidales bacterium]
MRITNSTWPINNVVDVFPIGQDPGADAAINPKHAVMIIRNVPIDSFARVKTLLTQVNYLDDDDPDSQLDKRRWFFRVGDLSAA